MTDNLSKEKRQWVMSRISGRDTKPELIVRSLLHRRGFRFSLHRRNLPGVPDIVLAKYHTVIFVHGCFWHRHPGCRQATMPKSRREFWEHKFACNQERDARHYQQLRQQGWQVIVAWECEVMAAPTAAVERIIAVLLADVAREPSRYDQLPARTEVLRVAEKKLHWRLRHKKQP